MATVLESLAVVPRSSAVSIPPRAFSPFAASSPISGVHFRRFSAKSLPEFTALKIRTSPSSRCLVSSGSTSRLAPPRGLGIVCAAQTTAVEVPAVETSTWKSFVLDSELPVLVEFWAPWCGPCRMIQPVIDELSKEYSGKLRCYKVNTDDSPSIATRYGIRSIPTVMIFKSGEKKDAVIGAVPKSTLTNSIDKLL